MKTLYVLFNKILNYVQKSTKRHKIILAATFLAIICLAILHTDLSPDLYFIHWEPLEDITCHYSDLHDSLPSIDSSFSPSPKSIFFHETSCNGGLNSRQACAIESAARLHPKWQIHVLFSGPVAVDNLNQGTMRKLKEFPNVKFARVHILDYAEHTPLEKMVKGGALNRTRWRVSHTADVLRYLTLYKWGGIYLDLDVVVAKSFDGLARNWAARESGYTIAAGTLAFSRDNVGRLVANAAISDFKARYRGDEWGRNGPGVITRVLKSMCSVSDVTVMSATTCQGFEVYDSELFYPIPWYHAIRYFDTKDLKVEDNYTYHVWNKLTHDIKINKDSVYAKLAKKFCPKTYESNGLDFGL